MKRFQKSLSLAVSGVLLISIMLGGCGETKQQSTQALPKEESAAGEADTNSNPAADEIAKGETVVLDWYIGGTPQEKQEDVFAEINKILVEKLNIQVNFHYIDFGNYGQQMQMLMTSGEKIDMMFTSNWANDFYSDVSKGAYQEISMDMIQEYGPDIIKEVPEGAWTAGMIDNKVYAIPNIQVLARWPAILLQKKYADKYNFDTSSPKNLEDFTPLLEEIAKNETDIYPIRLIKNSGVLSFYISKMGLEYFSETNPLGIRIADPNLEVVNLYETEEMKDFLNLLREWYNKGIIRKDAASVTDMSGEYKNGKVASIFAVNNPDMVADQAAQQGLTPEDMVVVTLSDPYLATASVVSTMTAINAQSPYVKECIMVLNEFFNAEDSRVQNLLSFGIEGINYNKVEEDLIEVIPNTGYYENCGWAHGSLFTCYRTNSRQPAWYPAGPDINSNATVSPMMGFSFDSTPVKNELAQVAAVMDEFVPSLQTGSADVDTTLEQMNEKLEQAGLETLKAEIQKQLDAWKNNK